MWADTSIRRISFLRMHGLSRIHPSQPLSFVCLLSIGPCLATNRLAFVKRIVLGPGSLPARRFVGVIERMSCDVILPSGLR